MSGKVAIFGASGLVGGACIRHFEDQQGWDVVALSRRAPPFLRDAAFRALDLMDREACESVLGALDDVTHVIYAALYEEADVIRGWRARHQMETNETMLRNAMEPLMAGARLRHVSFLQGTKAYGAHLAAPPVPAKERWPRHPHDNFYWLQEDWLRAQAAAGGWHWTCFRPQTIFGFAMAVPLNLQLAMGVHAVLRREQGLALSHPGGAAFVNEAIDARLIARACHWAATAENARDEIFNITNGDCMTWPDLWPAVARHFAMEMGPPEPERLADGMVEKAALWSKIAAREGLREDDLERLMGATWQFADWNFALGKAPPPVIVSTIKLRQAGFHDCIDTEDMLVELFTFLQDERVLPR